MGDGGPRDQSKVADIDVGSSPSEIVFDGTNLFVIASADEEVNKVLPG